MSENGHKIELPASIVIRDLAQMVEKSPIDIIKKLMSNGVMASINQAVDFDTLSVAGFERGLRELQHALAALERELGLAAAAGEALQRCHERCLQIQETLDQWSEGRDPQQVRWARVGSRQLTMHCTPLKISCT